MNQRTMTATQLILVWIRRLRHAVLFFADRLAIVAPTISARYIYWLRSAEKAAIYSQKGCNTFYFDEFRNAHISREWLRSAEENGLISALR